MHVSHLALHDFRSYPAVDVPLGPGVTVFLGRNGQGKTNLVEAVDYLSTLSSHRVSSDVPLIRAGADQAVIQAAVVKSERTAIIEVDLNAGRANKARVNRNPVTRLRDVVGLVRTVVFSPEDLALVKGDPSDRRRFLDDTGIMRSPRLAGIRADYDRVVRQRNTLLKSGYSASRRGNTEGLLATLSVWDEQLAALGAEITVLRRDLVRDLQPHLADVYTLVAGGTSRSSAGVEYRPRLPVAEDATVADVAADLLEEVENRRRDELDRGVTLVGPHRDEVMLSIGYEGDAEPLPAKGYASHGESWSLALALKLASLELLRSDGDDPILILDDVFAELDTVRRRHLIDRVHGVEQVLITAAVEEDVPTELDATVFRVENGEVVHD